MSNNLTKSLEIALADSYALALKTQNYHWNVEGPNFSSLHALFEEQYNELLPAIDEIAERIRTLGFKAPASYKEFEKLTTIKEGDSSLDENAMVKDLFDSQQQIAVSLKSALEVAQDAGDEVTTDLMIGRLATHEKNAWMLRSSLPQAIRDDAAKPASYAA